MLDFELSVSEGALAERESQCMEGRSHRADRGTFRVRRVVAAISMMLAVTAVAGSQKPKANGKQDSEFVLRQTVRRVRVDVVVTDTQGNAVRGLQASDFQISEDGKPQAIRQFEFHSDESAEAALPKRPRLPKHTFMNLPDGPERGPLTVVLYDVLNTPMDDQPYARAQLLEFLKKSTGRRIAVFVLGDRLRLLQGFTSDADLLVRAANRAGGPTLLGYSAELPGDPFSLPQGLSSERTLPAEEHAKETEGGAVLKRRIGLTIRAFGEISHFLAAAPGRKNLIWFSGAFPVAIVPSAAMPVGAANGNFREEALRDDSEHSFSNSIGEAENLLNSAEVAVYPVDAQGLHTYMATNFEKLSAEIATLRAVAEETGGRAFYNTNGLKEALETAADDGSSYYSLLYAPTNTKFEGSLRRISVHVARAHYHLAYRRSYYAVDVSSKAKRQTAPSGEDMSNRALEEPTQFGAPLARQIIFAAHVEPVGAAAPATPEEAKAIAEHLKQEAKGAHRRFVPPSTPVQVQQYTIQFGILASQLEIPKSRDGMYHPQLWVAARAYSAEGDALWDTRARIDDPIPGSKMAGVRENGLQVELNLSAPLNSAVLRLAVLDERNGHSGSMEIRLPLPPDQPHTATVAGLASGKE